jgi:PAS domain S-box-containing protein/diguanylate cyclase (GGDEF)-like protein
MRVIDPRAALIEHDRMEPVKDARGVKTLSRQALEQMVTLISDAILLVDAQSPKLAIVYTNPAFEDLTGYTAEELIGAPWTLPRRDSEGQPELERLKAAIGRAQVCHATIADVRKDGTSWSSEVTVAPLHNGRGDLAYFLCIQKPALESGSASSDEVTALQRELVSARQRIASMDRVDPATGLMRVSYFQEVLRRDLAIARRDRRFVTVLVLEIVEFEAYRQTFGTKAADSCQRMIGAQVMRTLRRAGDLCARLDDSRLVAAVLGQQPDEVGALIEQISANVRGLGLHNPRAKSGKHISIRTAVAGWSPGRSDDPETLIARAQAELEAPDASRAALP